MAAIIAHWELPAAWMDPKAQKKAFIRWSHTAKAFGIKDLCFVENPREPMPRFGDAEINLHIVQSLEEALLIFPEYTPVYIEEGGANFQKFIYPKNPVFVVGSDFGQLPKADISIDTITPLNAEIALGIVLGGAKWH